MSLEIKKTEIERMEALFMNFIGILQASNLNRLYENLFNVMIKKILILLIPIVERTSFYSTLTQCILKFLEEITAPRYNRINFQYNSTQAILLFKTTAKIFEIYFSVIFNFKDLQNSEIYDKKYKPLSLIYRIFNNLILTKIITEKSQDLFHDNFSSIIQMLIKGISELPQEEIFSFSNKMKVCFEFIQLVIQKYPLIFIKNIPLEIYTRLLSLMKEGFLSIHQFICISCYETIENLMINVLAKNLLSKEYIEITIPILENILQRSLENMLRGEISNLESISNSLFCIFTILKEKANKILYDVLSIYGNDVRKNVKENVEGLSKFSQKDIHDISAKSEFKNALKKMIDLMKITEEMIIS